MANPNLKSSHRESTRISGFSREAQELTPENLQKLLRYVATTCRLGVHTPRSDWRIFIPWRPFAKKAVGREFPFRSMGFLNVMTYNWMTKTIYRIYKKKHLDAENVNYVPFEESSQYNRLRLETIWNSELTKRGSEVKLSTVLIRHSLKLFLTALILNLIGGIITLICPTVLFRWLLEYAQSAHTDIVYGFVLVLLVFLSESCRSFLHTGSMFISILCASRLKAGFMAFMYKKILHARGLQGHTIGELVNVFANDSQRLFDLCVHIPAFLVAPFIVVSALVYCSVYIGPWCLVGCAYLVLHFLYQHTISRANSYIRSKTITATDKRVQLTVELVTLIKNIKMNAWEKSFAERITKCRESEESCLRKAAYVQNASVAIIPLVTFFSVVTIFGGYIGSGNSMLPSQAFVIMSVYNLIRTTTSLLPSIIRNWSDFKLGLKRAEGILKMDEVDFLAISSKTKLPAYAIEVEDATFCWMRYETCTVVGENDLDLMFVHDDQSKRLRKSPMESVSVTSLRSSSPPKKPGVYVPILVDIRFNIAKGKMVAICGHVGSGKSSLLSGLTGQMKLSKGRVAIQGKIGYVRQQAWIFHGTVRENILFGSTFDERRYRSTIAQCLLAVDLNNLPLGDETLIGERGINLSEGQKQRVGLARAIYADPDVLLLDDPMSAVDAAVCQHLFQNCLKEATRLGKTVLFNTQQIHFLSKCDEVIFLKKGRILRMGSHLALMRSDEEYRTMVTKSLSKIGLTRIAKEGVELLASEEEREIRTIRISSVPSFAEDVNKELEDEMEEEEYLPSKSVNRETYLIYLKAVGGKMICAFVILTFLMTALLIFFSDLWLSNYLRRCDDSENSSRMTAMIACENVSLWIFMVVYLSLALASVVMTGIRGYFFVKASMRASAVIHKKILAKLLKTSISFFEEMPPGKILGTISSGMDGIDVRLPLQLERLVQNMSSVLICVLSVTLTFPKFLIFVAITSIIFYFLQTVSRLVNRQLKIAESLTKSPMYGHLSSTTHGLETIHAFKKMADYTIRFQTLVDNHVSCLLMIASYTRWIGFRLEMLAIVFTSITAFLVVVTKDQVQISFAGLAIVYASELNSLLRHTIRYLADTEARFTSVERIESFIKNTQEEGPFRIEETRPPPQWPTYGHIHFENFSLKYGPKHPLVLSNITCDINPQEKIGIIGRTGSGKSSLTVALFRLVEHTQGTITIDGVNIAKIGLYDLRSRMSIVPQDPTLYAGTLRYNLDPMGIYTDEEVWKALESCFMKKRVMHLSKKLDTEVVESGGHFSTGERQLFCLARAFLKHSKIMVLDEVASSADLEIDQYLQNTIEESFGDCTILTIAHKIKTLLSCDRIMVIENGTIVEYDKPAVLLKSKSSRLNNLLS